MEFANALEEFSGTTDHNSVIIKGKRTKRRQRPLSPVGRAVAATSFSSSGKGSGESGTSEGGGREREVLGYIYSLIPSSTTCTSDISADTSTDQEDEDMANCLILLAQGESCRKQIDEDDDVKMEKYTSRRFNEMVTSTTGGKAGFFVYECKTCNRSFPSFQALGGHRASHKKPKVTIEEKKATILVPNCIDDDHQEDEEEEEKEKPGQFNRLSPPLSVQSTRKLLPNSNNKKAKIHECGICGAEFSSGQALGGHMRRHRNHMTSTKVSMILDTASTHDPDESSYHDVQKPRNIFPLDLNLPAPAEDDLHRDLKFQFSANQQPHLGFSAPAMVDCHY